MLFPYTYVPHQMEKMQVFIDFIFFEVWCKATPKIDFSFNLCTGNPELFEVMKKFYYSDKKNADFFYSNIERIYSHFARLKPKHIRRLKWWYCRNNDIDQLCSKNSTYYPVRYTDIELRYTDLAKDLRIFFTGIYDFDAADIKAKVGDIDDHYKNFVQTNRAGKCPFCGINDLLGEYHSKREAYDHYLPKALYPFNAINFKNLVPACHHCNSSYKTSKDPAFTPKDPTGTTKRRAVFYPYTSTSYAIELQVTLQHSDIANLTPMDVSLQFGPAALSEKINTWKDVYGIEERYKAKFCAENDGKYWLTQALDEWQWSGRSPSDFLTTLARQAIKKPYAECNFLKKPFLDACKQVGIF